MAYRTIHPSNEDFRFVDGIKIVNRAYMEISKDCPNTHAELIQNAIWKGWIKCVANVPDVEYTWEKLL